MTRNTQDEWCIEGFHDGWKLVVRPRVPLRLSIPRSIPEWLALAVFLYLASRIFPGFLLAPNGWTLEHFFLYALVLLCLSGFGIAALWFFYVPPSFRQALHAQRPIEVLFHASTFECEEGVFQNACLSTLRLVPLKRLDRSSIVFSGAVLKEAPLIGWPGVPEDTANEIIAAVANRTGANGS